MNRLILFICLFVSCSMYSQINGQNNREMDFENQIAASQEGASKLIYSTSGLDIPEVIPGTFYKENECSVRFGIPNFFHKLNTEKEVTIAFIGGSITKGDFSYRLQISKYLEKLYSKVKFKWINAGVSGTGTDLGCFRLKEHVLSYEPDLIFIEFSVNGAYQIGLEGMIRKIIKHNANADICVLHTISASQTKAYQQGRFPAGIIRMEKIAEHYKIPSIHLAYETSILDGDGKICWYSLAGCGNGRIAFSNDGLHPMVDGGNLYAAAIARGLKKMKEANIVVCKHLLPEPKYSSLWDEANMYLPKEIATFDSKWKICRTSETQMDGFKDWFDDIAISGEMGASFSFIFEGDMFGIFDIGGPECGQMEIYVDGIPVALKEISEGGLRRYEKSQDGSNIINRFNKFCNNRYRGQHEVICVEYGVHNVIIKISDVECDKKEILGEGNWKDINNNPNRYNKTFLFMGRILIRGKAYQQSY